ncbi:MAG TPA: 4-alpha-glucanotransferase [Rhodothermales bacterium]
MQLSRSSGILLHVSSLPSPFGIGDLGSGAHAFLDYLHRAGQRVWQVLPLVPVDNGGSPYSSSSTFAGNPLFVSPELLAEEGLVDEEVVRSAREEARVGREDRVDYRAAHALKDRILGEALRGFRANASPALVDAYQAFRHAQEHWLGDYALFTAIKESQGGQAWTSWPSEVSRRDPLALDAARRELAERVEHHAFAQFLFERQWQRLRQRANSMGIRIFGDLPIYVAHDSADVWAHPELFHLDGDGNPTVVSGVPPDYFSETGQRWGNPIYRWDLMAMNDYRWWLDRFERCFQLVDLLRIDHFRGMQAYWEIPASEPTAVHGRWVAGPGAALFKALERRMGRLPIVAEDLGIITPDVTALMEELGLPGMAVLHFAFGGDATSSYLPHNFKRDLVAYTGTHDNDTTVGWWRARADATLDSQGGRERAYAARYLRTVSDSEVHWAFIHLLMVSVANLVIVPMQDVIGVGSEGRMNVPGKNEGNWLWRARASDLREDSALRLREMAEVYGRA